MYGAATVALGLLAGLTVAATGLARRLDLPPVTGRKERPPAARWARSVDLAPLRVASSQTGRLTLGRHGRRLLAAEPGQSAIVFGPTQTHKTSGLAIPALLEWEGPVLCTSVKSDLLAHTLARREALGEAWVFDPPGSPTPSARGRRRWRGSRAGRGRCGWPTGSRRPRGPARGT